MAVSIMSRAIRRRRCFILDPIALLTLTEARAALADIQADLAALAARSAS